MSSSKKSHTRTYNFFDPECVYSPYFPQPIRYADRTWQSVAHYLHFHSARSLAESHVAWDIKEPWVLNELFGSEHLRLCPDIEERKIRGYAIFELDKGNLICKDRLEHSEILNGIPLIQSPQTDLEVYLANRVD